MPEPLSNSSPQYPINGYVSVISEFCVFAPFLRFRAALRCVASPIRQRLCRHPAPTLFTSSQALALVFAFLFCVCAHGGMSGADRVSGDVLGMWRAEKRARKKKAKICAPQAKGPRALWNPICVQAGCVWMTLPSPLYGSRPSGWEYFGGRLRCGWAVREEKICAPQAKGPWALWNPICAQAGCVWMTLPSPLCDSRPSGGEYFLGRPRCGWAVRIPVACGMRHVWSTGELRV
jgi:hypothetical protein